MSSMTLGPKCSQTQTVCPRSCRRVRWVWQPCNLRAGQGGCRKSRPRARRGAQHGADLNQQGPSKASCISSQEAFGAVLPKPRAGGCGRITSLTPSRTRPHARARAGRGERKDAPASARNVNPPSNLTAQVQPLLRRGCRDTPPTWRGRSSLTRYRADRRFCCRTRCGLWPVRP